MINLFLRKNDGKIGPAGTLFDVIDKQEGVIVGQRVAMILMSLCILSLTFSLHRSNKQMLADGATMEAASAQLRSDAKTMEACTETIRGLR